MSYVVKEINKDKYKIYNKDQDLYINMEMSKERAHELARKMNLGAGFGDWIPDFFNAAFPPVYK